MLFGGLSEAGAQDWEGAKAGGDEEPDIWKDITGTEGERVIDRSLFCVTEQEGMEVY
jgi:hypothetical protein